MEEIRVLQKQLEQAPTILQRVGILPKSIDPTGLIDVLLGKIAEKYFTTLIEGYIHKTPVPAEEVQALNLDFTNWLTQNVGRLAGASDQAQLSLAYKIDMRLRANKFTDFTREAEAVFLGNGNPASIHLRYSGAISLIARAIQDTALLIPYKWYSGKENVPEEIEVYLHDILVEVDKIKKEYRFKEVPDIATSTNLLYHKIATADDYVWLPLKPLITAPLAQKELLLYAREDEGAKQLANQIVKSDGVILITGYRGVGKSTFINEMLDSISEAQKRQGEEVPWEIVPVQMNVAKTANVGGALRLCIRAIYRTFRQLEGQGEQILTRREQEHLWFANLRASYKVSMSQAEALSKSKSLQGEFGFKPGDLFVGPLKTAVMGFLPALAYKTSKDWNEKMDRTISLLDYDEDRAEEDVVQFIAMLTNPRRYKNRQVGVKLVFIFDEMDKMEAKEGQDQLIRSLKNLFLTRHAVFLLVTSKEFYYMLLEDRKKEDSILGSYFSSVVTVPMFSSADTQKLFMNLLADSSELSGKEQTLISNLARYLTYRAHGLPREIIREIRSIQQWSTSTLQPYITDRLLLPNAIQIYALIEDVIENLTSRSGSESGEKDNPLMRERIWLSEGRQEQIRRGLYILVEELLNQGSFTVDLNAKFSSYDTNFSTVAYIDFYDIFDQLSRKLSLVKLPDDPTTLFFERVASEPPGASGQSAGKQIAIRVLPSFYAVTGRQIVQTEQAGVDDSILSTNPDEVMEQVNNLLGQESLFSTRRALNYLSQYPSLPLSTPVQDKLFKIFISPGDLAYRIDAGKHLPSDGFYRNLEGAYPDWFIKEERNETLLKQFIDLSVNGAANKNKRDFAFLLLRDLLERNLAHQNPLPTSVFQTVLTEMEKFISRKKDAQDILNKILSSSVLLREGLADVGILGPNRTILSGKGGSYIFNNYEVYANYEAMYSAQKRDGAVISATIVSVLLNLASKAGTKLPLVVLENDIYSLEQETLNSLLISLSQEEIETLWKKALEKKGSLASIHTMVAALLRLSSEPPKAFDLIQTWLTSEKWSALDDEVMRLASKINPKLFYELERVFGRERDNPAFQKLQIIDPEAPAKTTTISTAGKAGTTAADRYKNPWWLNLLLGGGMLALYIFVPLDMIQTFSIWDRLLGRLLQFVGPVALLIGLGVLIVWLTVEFQNKPARKWYVLGILAAFGLSALMYWLLYRGGYPITVWGEILLTVIVYGVYWVPALAQGILCAIMPKPKEVKAEAK